MKTKCYASSVTIHLHGQANVECDVRRVGEGMGEVCRSCQTIQAYNKVHERVSSPKLGMKMAFL